MDQPKCCLEDLHAHSCSNKNLSYLSDCYRGNIISYLNAVGSVTAAEQLDYWKGDRTEHVCENIIASCTKYSTLPRECELKSSFPHECNRKKKMVCRVSDIFRHRLIWYLKTHRRVDDTCVILVREWDNTTTVCQRVFDQVNEWWQVTPSTKRKRTKTASKPPELCQLKRYINHSCSEARNVPEELIPKLKSFLKHYECDQAYRLVEAGEIKHICRDLYEGAENWTEGALKCDLKVHLTHVCFPLRRLHVVTDKFRPRLMTYLKEAKQKEALELLETGAVRSICHNIYNAASSAPPKASRPCFLKGKSGHTCTSVRTRLVSTLFREKLNMYLEREKQEDLIVELDESTQLALCLGFYETVHRWAEEHYMYHQVPRICVLDGIVQHRCSNHQRVRRVQSSFNSRLISYVCHKGQADVLEGWAGKKQALCANMYSIIQKWSKVVMIRGTCSLKTSYQHECCSDKDECLLVSNDMRCRLVAYLIHHDQIELSQTIRFCTAPNLMICMFLYHQVCATIRTDTCTLDVSFPHECTSSSEDEMIMISEAFMPRLASYIEVYGEKEVAEVVRQRGHVYMCRALYASVLYTRDRMVPEEVRTCFFSDSIYHDCNDTLVQLPSVLVQCMSSDLINEPSIWVCENLLTLALKNPRTRVAYSLLELNQ